MTSYQKSSKWVILNGHAINLALVRYVEVEVGAILLHFDDDHYLQFAGEDKETTEETWAFIMKKIECD
jgi:predicted Rossmann-fold nucleotide-binding protein